MIEVKDEILSGNPTFRIRNKNGDIVMDEVDIEQITPVEQEGTALNKSFFDTVKSGYDSVGRYNIPSSISKAPKYNNDLLAGEYTTTDNVTWTKDGITFAVKGVGGPRFI